VGRLLGAGLSRAISKNALAKDG
jgi:hypothetical protein